MPMSRGKAFVTSSTVFAHGQPFVAPAPLMNRGAFRGYYLGSAKPMFLRLGRLMTIGAHSLIVEVAGEKNTGKSTLLKDWAGKTAAEQAGLDPTPDLPPEMRVRFNDRKPNKAKVEDGKKLRGEFTGITDYLLGDTISLAEHGLVNPFDPKMGASEKQLIEIAYDIAGSVLGRPVENYEGPALEIAVKRMYEEEKHNINAFRTYLATPRIEDVKSHYTDEAYTDSEANVAIIDDARLYSEFREDSVRMAGVFKTLLGGIYGGIFGGDGSLYDVLAGNIVNLDWTGVSGPGGDLLETLIYRWQTVALRKQLPLNPNLWINDEEGTRIKNLPHAMAFAQYVREARAYAMITMLATQFSTDFYNLGDDGSTIRGLGREIDNGISVRIWGRQPNTPEIIESITRHGVSLGDALSTTLLPQGCWGIKLPDRPIQFFQHVVSPKMLPVYETNLAAKGLAEEYAADNVAYVQERIRKIHALWPSVTKQLANHPETYSDVRQGFNEEIGETRETVRS